MPQQKPINQPDLQDILDAQKQDVLKAINCVQVGIIQAFYSGTQQADIEIALKKVITVNEDGTRVLAPYPVLLKVPVFVLTGGGSSITMPITAGDTCIILFNDREIDNWYNSGAVSAPTTYRLHDKSDAMAIVGIRNLENVITNYFNGLQILFDSVTAIQMTHQTIKMIGNVQITGNLEVDGDGSGGGGTLNLTSNLVQSAGHSIHAGNGATGTYTIVNVVDGIVISGT